MHAINCLYPYFQIDESNFGTLLLSADYINIPACKLILQIQKSHSITDIRVSYLQQHLKTACLL